MRISTNLFHMQSFASIEKHQNSVLAIQEKLTTGQRVNRPSDDPVATSQINALNTTMNTLDQYAKNGDYAKSMLSYEETQIDSTVEAVQRTRELTIQMMNETYTAEQRQAAGAEIGQLIDHVANLMNSTNSEGELLFGGNVVTADAAFVEDTVNGTTATGLSYYAYIGSTNAGTEYNEEANYGGRFVQIGFDSDDKLNPGDNGDPSRVRVTDNGADVFNVSSGGSYLPAGVDHNILNVMVELKDYLDQGLQPPAEIGEDLKTSIADMSTVLAEVGSRQNRIENQYDAGQEFRIALEERRSKLQDQDVVEGISEFTMKQNALQMAQQVFSKVQGMTLFDYIG